MTRSLKNLYPEKYAEYLSSEKYKLRNSQQVEFKVAKEAYVSSVGNACEHCGEAAIDVHHIIPIEKGGTNDASNFVCLCRRCHQRVHDNVYKVDSETKELSAIINANHIIPEDQKPQYIKDFEAEMQTTVYRSTGPYYYFMNDIKFLVRADEMKELTGYKSKLQAKKEEAAKKRESVQERAILNQYKIMFREQGNKAMWHQMCKVIKAWDSLEETKKLSIFEKLNKFV